MEIVNRTPFTVAPNPGRLDFPAHSVTLIVRATLALVHDGAAVVLAEQDFPGGDIPFDDGLDGAGAPRYDMDFAPFKPATDLFLVGHCHPPGGTPTARCQAGFSVGERRVAVTVTGDRHWQVGMVRTTASEPIPFTRMPLRYEHAFGGPGYDPNPIGKGHGAGKRRPASDRALLLPNVEHPDRLVASPAGDPGPAGLGPVDRRWAGRTRWLGTYDSRWEHERWPWYPEDFDWRYWSAAPPGLTAERYLRGDEPLILTHVHPRQAEFQTRLPDLRLRGFVRRATAGASALEEVPMRLDTLWIDADAERAVLVWRGACETVDADASDISQAFIDAETASAPGHPVEHFEQRFRERLAEIEAEWAIDEEKPPPADAASPEPAAPEEAAATPEEQALARAIAELEQVVEPLPGVDPEAPTPDPEALDAELARYSGREPEDTPDTGWTRARVAVNETPLAGEDLSGLDLSGLDLTGRDLRGTLLDRADLAATVLAGANLSAASLTAARVDGAVFAGTWLAGADLSRVTGAGADFSSARMAESRLVDAQLPDARLQGADLTGADLTDASLIGADFTAATLTSAHFVRASLRMAKMIEVNVRDAYFGEAVLTRVAAAGARLAEADFSGASLPGADFSRADLAGALFEGAQAPDMNLDDADLTGFRGGEGSDFSDLTARRARAAGSMWENAVLPRAVFSAADLTEADFSGADLRDANLAGANAPGARFIGAALSGASLASINLFQGSLERARLDGAQLGDSNCYGVEFLDADTTTATLHGANLTMTKLAGRAPS